MILGFLVFLLIGALTGHWGVAFVIGFLFWFFRR